MFYFQHNHNRFIFFGNKEVLLEGQNDKEKTPTIRKAEVEKNLKYNTARLRERLRSTKNTPPDSTVGKAMQEAQSLIDAVDSIDKNSEAVDQIEKKHLSQILILLDYFEFQNNLPYQQSRLKWALNQDTQRLTRKATIDFYQRLDQGSDFPPEVIIQLKDAQQQRLNTIIDLHKKTIMSVIPETIDLSNFAIVKSNIEATLKRIALNTLFPLPEEEAINANYNKKWEKAEEESNRDIQPEIPERPANAPGAKEFLASIKDLPREQQMAAIIEQAKNGNIPNFMRKLQTVTKEKVVNGKTIEITTQVMPHYLCIGDDNDYFIIPMNGVWMGELCNKFKMRPPTTELVEEIQRQATNIPFIAAPSLGENMDKPEGGKVGSGWNQASDEYRAYWMESLDMAKASNDTVKKEMDKHKEGLTAAGKKDIVIDVMLLGNNSRSNFDQREIIYGAVDQFQKRVQPRSDAHFITYYDYSHGARLVAPMVKVTIRNKDGSIAKDKNGKEIKDRPMRYDNALKHKSISKVLSKRGRFKTSGMYGIKPLP